MDIEFQLKTKIVQSEGNVVSDMDGDKVMLNMQKGNYYNLGVIGGEIWDLIESPISIDELVDCLLSTYDINLDDCRKEVVAFLNDLHKEGLIRLMG
ncbi:MAG: lasso peptide biosynthesis PqqD family chaperone [Bacillota bacterium]|nr:lasso peptide biosynthesis PqqD family chaperone [Bacillota bacterium]